MSTLADLIARRLQSNQPRPLAALLKANLDHAAHAAATSPLNLKRPPTQAQIEAGNYPKGHWKLGGLKFSIENPAHSHRRSEWPPLTAHYGYIRGTTGMDGEQVDAFLQPGTDEAWDGPVFVIDQLNADGSMDEHKVMVGWDSQLRAERDYLNNYPPGWKLGAVTQLTMAELREWLLDGDTSQPLARALHARIAKEFTQSSSATSGITAYGNTERTKRLTTRLVRIKQRRKAP